MQEPKLKHQLCLQPQPCDWGSLSENPVPYTRVVSVCLPNPLKLWGKYERTAVHKSIVVITVVTNVNVHSPFKQVVIIMHLVWVRVTLLHWIAIIWNYSPPDVGSSGCNNSVSWRLGHGHGHCLMLACHRWYDMNLEPEQITIDVKSNHKIFSPSIFLLIIY